MKKNKLFIMISLIVALLINTSFVAYADTASGNSSNVYSGGKTTIGVTDKGELIITGEKKNDLSEMFKGFSNIVDFSYNGDFVALTADGEIISYGLNRDAVMLEWGKFNNIANSVYYVGGLKEDGTVVMISRLEDYEDIVLSWQDIVDITALQVNKAPYICALNKSGTVKCAYIDYYENCAIKEREVSEKFTEIIKIDAAYDILAGLKEDGTVVAYNYFEMKDIELNWTDIIDIAVTDYQDIFGLKSDGTVVGYSISSGSDIDMPEWTDVNSISGGEKQLAAVRKDGKVLAFGDNEYGQCDVDSWDLTPLTGDANDDNEVNAKDALAILKVTAKIDSYGAEFIPGSWSPLNAKVTEGGIESINATDALEILKYSAGIISEFGVVTQ